MTRSRNLDVCIILHDILFQAVLAIYYQSSAKYFTTPLRSFCAFIGLRDEVRFFANTYVPDTRLLPYLLVYYWSGLSV